MNAVSELIVAGVGAMVAVAVAVTQSKVDPDMVAIIGAVLGTVIATLSERNKDRTLSHTITVIIASAVIGAILPGALCGQFYPQAWDVFTWHAWAGLGFASSLFGWGIVGALMALSPALAKWINSRGTKILGKDENEK